MREQHEERTEEVSKRKPTDPAQPALAVEREGEDAARLLPCPFCGAEARLGRNPFVSGFQAWCDNIECDPSPITFVHSTEAGAIEAWNTRVDLGSDDLYDAGFAIGVQAVFQQLEGIEDYDGLQGFIADYWGEGEEDDGE